MNLGQLTHSSCTCSRTEPFGITATSFYRLHALPLIKPTLSKLWRKHWACEGSGIAPLMTVLHCSNASTPCKHRLKKPNLVWKNYSTQATTKLWLLYNKFSRFHIMLLLSSSAFMSRVSSAIWQQRYQLSAIAAAPSSLVCGQLLTICDIVWHLPQVKWSKPGYLCSAFKYHMHFLKRLDMATHSFTCKQAIPAFTPQPQRITALWLLFILPSHGG